MSQTFLQAVGAVLTPGLSATVELQGLPDGQIKLIYTPNIGITPENATDAIVQLRAAIAKPMIVSGTPVEIEDAFAQLVADKSRAVARGLSALDQIDRLAEAALAEVKVKAVVKPAAAVVAAEADDDEGDLDADDDQPANPAAPVAAVATTKEF